MVKQGKLFTDRRIQLLKPRDKPFLESEPGGLYIRVRPSGRKVFMAVYTWEGKQRWLTIGRFPEITIKQAREKVREIQSLVENNTDPTLAKREHTTERITAPTISEFADIYIEKWAKPKKKSTKEDRRILDVYVLPAIGQRKVKDLTRAEIIHLLDDVADRGPIMANRTLAVIRKMLNFALDRAVIELSPCQNITPPGKEVKKERFLTADEIKVLWPKMTEELTDQTNRAIKMILATAQRPNEVATMQWNEIDGEWWTIPAKKTKNGKEHRVFLNKISLELMGETRKKDFVFPSLRKENQPIHPNAFGKALRAKMEKFEGVEYFSAHDLRRTAATHIAELGYGVYVGKVLNHTDQSITAIYDRYAYDKEKRAALNAWGRKLEELIRLKVKGSKVINLR
ncbi:MAG: tyrosine-type recombinase/integrase [Desulfuromusa sp.]|nr:tyrosine-type recombinase/integrase [Desulfuromusa sp.]